MDYTKITFEELYSDFQTRMAANPHFKNIGSATLIGMFIEMLCGTAAMANFNQERILEEQFFKTARNDSSYIKLVKNFGYAPRRPVPAQAELKIVLKGPFPKEFKTATKPITISFSPDMVNLSYFQMPFRLEDNFAYTFTDADKSNCCNTDYRKTLRSGSKTELIANTHHKLQRYDSSETSLPIKCYQGEIKTKVFYGKDWCKKFQEEGQYYDINDLTFSNWYGKRDPFANIVTSKTDYNPEYGITKVEIVNDNDIPSIPGSYHPNSIVCDIEDHSIMLNNAIINNREGTARDNDVCLVETLEDKTIRISFSKLKYLATPGLRKLDAKGPNGEDLYQNLVVQYLSTYGDKANRTNAKESVLTHTNKFIINVDGKFIDITNNIEFVLKTDIMGGQPFESKKEMKASALAYFASMMKLVSKRDFIDYFSMLNKPINVSAALVFGMKDLDISIERNMLHKYQTVEEAQNKLKNLPQNYICYALASNMYGKINGTNNLAPINVLLHKENGDIMDSDGFIKENPLSPCTLYADEYENHIIDYIKFLISPEAYYNNQQKQLITDDSPQYLKNIDYINSDIKEITPINTIVYSMPPYMHYFDIVGDVKVKSSVTDLDAFKTKMSNKIYKYLNDHSNESREIYKSTIAKLYLDDNDVEAANINIKVSSLLSPTYRKLTWTNELTTDNHVRLFANYGIESVTGNSEIEPSDTEIIINEICVPKNDSYYVPFSKDSYECTYIEVNLQLESRSSTPHGIHKFTRTGHITDMGDFVKIILDKPIYIVDNIGKLEDGSPDFRDYENIYRIMVSGGKGITEEQINAAVAEQTAIVNAQIAADIQKYEPASNCKMYNYETKLLEITTSSTNNYWASSKYLSSERYNYDTQTNSTASVQKPDTIKSDYGLYKSQVESDNYITIDDVADALSQGITEDEIANDSVNALLLLWLYNLTTVTEANRAISLPYTVYSFGNITREETYKRLGNLIGDDDKTLSEYSFWNYFVPELIRRYYMSSNSNGYTQLNESTNIDDDAWTCAATLIMDIYKLLKAGITDSILDENNNIVNFSTDQDLAIVRCCVNFSYINN